jgi:hypothetical protein
MSVEPSGAWWSELNTARARGVNLALAISDTRGEIVLFGPTGAADRSVAAKLTAYDH